MTVASRCSRDGCDVEATAKCLEGFEPANTCPYASVDHSRSDDATPATPVPFVNLPTGEALTEAQASEVTREGPTRVVIVAGPSRSGKTTILTSLFEAFLEAPFGNFLFGGSRTLVGFERRCHHARLRSGRDIPHTPHTPVDVVEFLHLRLRSASGTAVGAYNLLLSDISGERFKAMRDSSAAVRKVGMLKRADHLCLVLDGEKLANPNERHSARADVRMLLRSILDADALSTSCRINIVIAKWDLVVAEPETGPERLFITQTCAELTAIAKRNGTTRAFEIAARPTTAKVQFAFGVPTLLRYWLQDPATPARAKIYLPRKSADMGEAARFAKSVFTAEVEGAYDVEWV